MEGFTCSFATTENETMFRFTPYRVKDGLRYAVSVLGERPLHFQMQPYKGGWRIIEAPKVPAWIKAVEEELSQAIAQHGSPDGHQ